MTYRTRQPSGLRFIALWCIASFVISFLLMFAVVILPALLMPWNLTIILVFGFLAIASSTTVSGFLVLCAIPAGAVHGLLRGVLGRALQHAEETASPFLIRYRLINFLYGCAAGMVLGAFGIGVAELLGDFRELMFAGALISMVAGALIGFVVGEIVRPKFEMSIATEHLPPDPFPKRMLAKEEDALLDDAEEVMRHLQDNEAKRRWATLYALGQLSEAEEYILGAVTVLAGYDPIDYVREAAQSDLLVWKKGLPSVQPDADFEITRRRVAQFSEPTAETNAESTSPARLELPEDTERTDGNGWEYRDFVYTWMHKEWPFGTMIKEDRIRQMVWDEKHAQILDEFERIQADGWEPMDAIGPSAIRLRAHSEIDSASTAILLVELALGGRGGGSLVSDWIEPTELRVPMRRKL